MKTMGKNDEFEESSLSPTVASSTPANHATDSTNDSSDNDVQEARRGLLKAIWQTAFVPRFSSRPIDLKTSDENPATSVFSSDPIDMEGYFSSSNNTLAGSFVRQSSCATAGTSGTNGESSISFQNSLKESSYLTPSEQGYLQELLRSDDLESIKRASARLSDKEVFPRDIDLTKENSSQEKSMFAKKRIPLPPRSASQRRRDSQVQEQLLEWHEKTTVMPSVVLQRVSSNQSAKNVPPLPTGGRTISPDNSLTQDPCSEGEGEHGLEKRNLVEGNPDQVNSVPNENNNDEPEDNQGWNSDLLDLNSWITRTQGVEVDEDGHTSTPAHMTSIPFKILGTSANDVSCQPMVLSPPLMEGLQNFMPESLSEHHYWLKYSMVRDGPGLMKMLRHCRASQYTILAIESTDGHVFGSFTSRPWRLTSPKKTTDHYYGSKDSFVWRMRQSRFEPCESVVEQLLMESKIDVFPFTSRNNYVQSCTTSGITLGRGEIKEDGERNSDECDTDDSATINHYGHAIKLDESMATGSTSSSETFGNPCLTKRESRGEKFEVANVELWAITPHDSVEVADQAEMRALFIEGNRHTDNNLNLIEILVGTHKSKV